jgi:hypothetical protein
MGDRKFRHEHPHEGISSGENIPVRDPCGSTADGRGVA